MSSTSVADNVSHLDAEKSSLNQSINQNENKEDETNDGSVKEGRSGVDESEEFQTEHISVQVTNVSKKSSNDNQSILNEDEVGDVLDRETTDENVLEEQEYIWVEETIMDDLGKEVTVKQKVPIIRETRHFERISVLGGEGDAEKTHKYIETITRVIKESALNEAGEVEVNEKEITEVIEHDERPDVDTIYTKVITASGEVEEVPLPPRTSNELVSSSSLHAPSKHENIEQVTQEKLDEKPKETSKKADAGMQKAVKRREAKPTQVKFSDDTQQTSDDSHEEESDHEEYVLEEEEEPSEDEADLAEKTKEDRLTRLKDNLRTVLVRLALAEKKRKLYMQLISISSEVKEDIINPPDPDKPSFKVPKKVKAEDKFRRMYIDKLMEYRELRSAILVKLAMEKKRKEEVKKRYDTIASDVNKLGNMLEDKLNMASAKLLPKNDFIFKNQSPQAMVKRLIELIGKLDDETKELMYKKKEMYQAKQQYDEITENEQGLSYKYALASKNYKDLLAKNDRRNEKLESLKTMLQKESLAVNHINQKCEIITKAIEEKTYKLDQLNLGLIRAREDHKDVHRARRKVENELRQEKDRIKLINHPLLVKEYMLVQDLLRTKQMEFQKLKRECISSLDKIKRLNASK